MHRLLNKTKVAAAQRQARWRDVDALAFRNRTGIDRVALETATRGFLGKIVTPWDDAYDTDRQLSNPRFDARPCIIVYCVCEADVAIALRLARGGSAATPFTIRSGGHCTAGFSAASGILIDVSGLYDVSIDV